MTELILDGTSFHMSMSSYFISILMLMMGIQASMILPAKEYRELGNPFDNLRLKNNELLMGEMRFKLDKVKHVVVQAQDIVLEKGKTRNTGMLIFPRSYRRGVTPSMQFAPQYVDELKAFFLTNIPDITFVEDYD